MGPTASFFLTKAVNVILFSFTTTSFSLIIFVIAKMATTGSLSTSGDIKKDNLRGVVDLTGEQSGVSEDTVPQEVQRDVGAFTVAATAAGSWCGEPPFCPAAFPPFVLEIWCLS